MEELINTVRQTLIDCPEVIAQATEINAIITLDSGSWVLDADCNYNPSESTILNAWLYIEEEDRPTDVRIPGVQPSDQYYVGRLIDPREFTGDIPRPGQENECVIDGMEGLWIWSMATEGAFLFDDILGTDISGFFRRT